MSRKAYSKASPAHREADLSTRTCAYLRKSRKDRTVDLDGRELTDEEILSRQQSLCEEMAARNGLAIMHYYRDVCSGETLKDRPEATAMFSAIIRGEWDAVVTVEVERLGRGSQGDQGRIVTALRSSVQNGNGGCRVITLTKTYHPTSEADMDYIEFGLFMSSRELSTITRRLTRGKMASVVSGQYIARLAPYGYDRVVVDEMKTLRANGDAKVVELVFGMAASGVPTGSIVRMLGEMGIATPSGRREWQKATVRRILRNEVYVGLVRWGRTKTVAEADGDLNILKRRVYTDDYLLVDGLHQAIVDDELFAAAQDALDHNRPSKGGSGIVNPFASLSRCAACHGSVGPIWDRNMGRHALTHRGPACGCGVPRTSWQSFREAAVSALEESRDGLAAAVKDPSCAAIERARRDELSRLDAEIESSRRGMRTAFDLLDQGFIDISEFAERHDELAERMRQAQEMAKAKGAESSIESGRRALSLIDEALALLHDGEATADQANRALKRVVGSIEYVCSAPPRTVNPPFSVEVALREDVLSWPEPANGRGSAPEEKGTR